MTDEEIICTFMEPRPKRVTEYNRCLWWRGTITMIDCRAALVDVRPCDLTLDRLREVQERLTREQWRDYRCWFTEHHAVEAANVPFGNFLLHATAAQKIKALAIVLRSEVEARS